GTDAEAAAALINAAGAGVLAEADGADLKLTSTSTDGNILIEDVITEGTAPSFSTALEGTYAKTAATTEASSTFATLGGGVVDGGGLLADDISLTINSTKIVLA